MLIKSGIIVAISIPSGTIKSKSSNPCNSGISAFQFLLVRLKVITSASGQPLTSSISIPSGTIKRVVFPGGATTVPRFQFLLVRLKVLLLLEESEPITQFQFLLVRLKDICCIKDSTVLQISIPSGTIKSRSAHEVNAQSIISIPSGTIKSSLGITLPKLPINFNSFWYD